MSSPVRAWIVSLAVLGVVVVAARADHGADERVEELMEKIHEGRRSPYRQLGQIVAGAEAPWPAVERTVAGFEPMVRALLESGNADIKDSADGYVDAVKELAAAVKGRDAAGVRKGFESLRQSCGDCHFEGGVGGELDD